MKDFKIGDRVKFVDDSSLSNKDKKLLGKCGYIKNIISTGITDFREALLHIRWDVDDEEYTNGGYFASRFIKLSNDPNIVCKKNSK